MTRWLAAAAAVVALVAGFVASAEPPRTPYVAALDAIDPDIVHGAPALAQARGLAVCEALQRGDPPPLWLFVSPAHPAGFGYEVQRRILAATRQHLCT